MTIWPENGWGQILYPIEPGICFRVCLLQTDRTILLKGITVGKQKVGRFLTQMRRNEISFPPNGFQPVKGGGGRQYPLNFKIEDIDLT